MPKTCKKPFHKNIKVVLWQKAPKKSTKYSRNKTILNTKYKNWPSYQGYSPLKGYSLCKMVSLGQELKMPETCEKQFYSNMELFCAKNRSKKHQIFEKWGNIENRPSCKGYSPWKMVSLGQKLKMPKTCEKPLYKNVRVVLCKKPLEKTPNIPEMRRF